MKYDMKNNIIRLSVLLIAAASLWSCKGDMVFDNVQPVAVTELQSPAADASIALFDADGAKTEFRWAPAKSDGVPVYSVVFYVSETDKDPVFTATADNNGTRSIANVLHTDMNRMAQTAGIKESQKGDVWWTVVAAYGTEQVVASTPRRKLTVTRMKGFIGNPGTLYITGSACEVPELADALQFRRMDDGSYEIFTQLKGTEGTDKYWLVDTPVDGPNKRVFGVTNGALVEDDAPLVLGTGESNSANEAYRISVDFTKGTFTKEKVTKVWYNYPNKTAENSDMTYAGKGVWKLDNKMITLHNLGDNPDNRYHFRATIGGKTVVFGHREKDTQEVPAKYDNSSYFWANEYENKSDWDYSFKFMPRTNGIAVNMTLNLSGATEHYSHAIDLGNLVPVAVTALGSPAADMSLKLDNISGSKQAFSWTRSGSAAAVTVYKVVFFKDAAGEQKVSEVEAGNSDAIDILHIDLDTIAGNAGVEAESEGTVYWSVVADVLGNAAMPEFAPRALKIRRFQGIPSNIYITGSASEYGETLTAAGKLKRLEHGKFEIYTQLKSGTYYFTDKTDGNGIRFAVNASNQIVESASPVTILGDAKVYRIRLDFTNNTAKLEAISKVTLQFSPNSARDADLTYKGKGVWSKEGYYVEFHQEGWGRDERYRFVANISEPSAYSEVWSALPAEDSRPNKLEYYEYYNIHVQTYNADRYSLKYKFMGELDYKTADVDVVMSPDVNNYHHKIYNVR